MKIPGRLSSVVRSFARAGLIAGGAMVFLLALAAQSMAGDVSAQPADSLNITSSTTGALPQPTSEAGWLSDFHISGFVSQTFGMWQNPAGLKQYTLSRNSLATSRTWLQADENWRLNEDNSFFFREWFIYEPPYAFNSAGNIYAGGPTHGKGAPGPSGTLCTPGGPAGCPSTKFIGGQTKPFPAISAGAMRSIGHFNNDFYNQYTLRDFWWENKTGPLTTYIGNQIVVWGQSLAFRVGDLINPQDTTWNFGFSNLEQSRMPQWMVHPILNLPEMGPLTSNFIEGVLNPRYSPQWSWDYPDGRFFDQMGVAGSVNQGFPSVSHSPSTRYDVFYLNRIYPGRTTVSSVYDPVTRKIFPAKYFVNHSPLYPGGRGITSPPFSHELLWCKNLGSGAQPFNPVPPALQRDCALGPNGTPVPWLRGQKLAVDSGWWKIPPATVENWEEGIRAHTLVAGTELTVFYLHWWNPYPNEKWTPFTNQWRFVYTPQNYVGVTADRPAPLPDWMTEYAPVVARAEVVYDNHASWMSENVFDLTGMRYTDTVNWMAALDLDQAFAPWLTSTGNLSANFEFNDFIALDNGWLKDAGAPWGGVGGQTTTNDEKNVINMLFSIGTSWWWGDFVPTWTMIFNPKGRTFLMFPSLILNPPWTKKYFLKLQAIEVLSGESQIASYKGESSLVAQFQYNFQVR